MGPTGARLTAEEVQQLINKAAIARPRQLQPMQSQLQQWSWAQLLEHVCSAAQV